MHAVCQFADRFLQLWRCVELMLDLSHFFVAVIKSRDECLVLALTAPRRIHDQKARRLQHDGLPKKLFNEKQAEIGLPECRRR